MEQSSRTPLVEHFSALDDPCQQAKVLYPLPEIVLPLPCATLAGAGADDFVEMRLWGKSNEITAIPLRLERLALTGALVTLEASGTRNKIAEVILRQAKPTTSLENRRKLAGWNLDDLDELIKGAA
jgi:hypothetical protein